MQRVFLLASLLISCNLFSQEFRKDARSQQQKEDTYNSYQGDLITKTDLLKALELTGVRIFKFPLSPFDKEYKLTVTLTEYVNGKISSAKNIYYLEKNTYTHFEDSGLKDSLPVLYAAYIDQLVFYTKGGNDSTLMLKLETYAGSDIMPIKTKKLRKHQFYNWRYYSKTNWIPNKEIPLLVCASSWYDAKNEVERFCGAVDLSSDVKETETLLKSSPHYYVVSYKVSEK